MRTEVGTGAALTISLSGRRSVAASVEAVWALLRAPEHWNRWLRRVDESYYRVTFEVGVGPFKGHYGGFLRIEPLEEGDSLRWQLEVQSPRGELRGSGSVELEGAEDETVVAYAGDMTVGGELAATGARLAASNARGGARELFKALEAYLTGRPPTEERQPSKEVLDYIVLPNLLKGVALAIGFVLVYRVFRRKA